MVKIPQGLARLVVFLVTIMTHTASGAGKL